jgi:hypothetical protein
VAKSPAHYRLFCAVRPLRTRHRPVARNRRSACPNTSYCAELAIVAPLAICRSAHNHTGTLRPLFGIMPVIKYHPPFGLGRTRPRPPPAAPGPAAWAATARLRHVADSRFASTLRGYGRAVPGMMSGDPGGSIR